MNLDLRTTFEPTYLPPDCVAKYAALYKTALGQVLEKKRQEDTQRRVPKFSRMAASILLNSKPRLRANYYGILQSRGMPAGDEYLRKVWEKEYPPRPPGRAMGFITQRRAEALAHAAVVAQLLKNVEAPPQE